MAEVGEHGLPSAPVARPVSLAGKVLGYVGTAGGRHDRFGVYYRDFFVRLMSQVR